MSHLLRLKTLFALACDGSLFEDVFIAPGYSCSFSETRVSLPFCKHSWPCEHKKTVPHVHVAESTHKKQGSQQNYMT